MINKRKQVISLTVEQELVKFLNIMANDKYTSVSQYIRSLIGMEYQKWLLQQHNYSEDDLLEDEGPTVDENGRLKF